MTIDPKFTPGPWMPGCFVGLSGCQCRSIRFERFHGAVATVEINNGELVGFGGNDAPDREEAVANAFLIAAAPDLFHALWSARSWVKAATGQDANRDAALAVFDAALRRASPAVPIGSEGDSR